MLKSLNIFFTIDSNYIQHFTVAVTSLLENNKHLNLDLYLIHDIADTKILNDTLNYIDSCYNKKLNLIAIDSGLFDRYKINLHVSKATYFRLLLSDILPSNIDKGLFLDSDLIVTGSIEELADLDLGDNYLMGSKDIHQNESLERLQSLGVPAKKYFNAGVILINLKKWRENNVSQQLINTAEVYMDKLLWWDQDVLNLFFYNRWSEFNSTFNSINFEERFVITPTIIHYASPEKPWHYLNTHPYKNFYWKYIKLTPYRNAKPIDLTFTNVLRKYYRLLKKTFKLN